MLADGLRRRRRRRRRRRLQCRRIGARWAQRGRTTMHGAFIALRLGVEVVGASLANSAAVLFAGSRRRCRVSGQAAGRRAVRGDEEGQGEEAFQGEVVVYRSCYHVGARSVPRSVDVLIRSLRKRNTQ